MTNNALILGISIGMGLLGAMAYLLGRYQSDLLNKIRTLEQSPPIEPEPVITMGAYQEPKELNETDTPVGLVESKTPQRLDWENEQSIEKEGRGLVGKSGS